MDIREASRSKLLDPIRPLWRAGRTAVFHVRNQLATPHAAPLFVLGNQKSGTSAIAALLGARTGQPTTVDLRREVGRQYYKRIVSGECDFESLVRRNRLDFSRPIVKEPNLTLFHAALEALYPEARFLFVVRGPHQNLRSILDRLSIAGNLPRLESHHMGDVDPGFELVLDGRWAGIDGGDHYIDRLCARWNACADVYLERSEAMHLVRYEDFQQDKVGCLDRIAAHFGFDARRDIDALVDRPFQRVGRPNVDLRVFFGENYARIDRLCADRMARFDYAPAAPAAPEPARVD